MNLSDLFSSLVQQTAAELPSAQLLLWLAAEAGQPEQTQPASLPPEQGAFLHALAQVYTTHTEYTTLANHTAQALILPPLDGAWLAAPIRSDEGIRGLILLWDALHDPFPTWVEHLLGAWAEQILASLAVEALRQSQAQMQATLNIYNEIAHIATSDTDWGVLLLKMAENLSQLFEAEACAITLWDAEVGTTRRLAAWGIDRETFLSMSRRPPNAPWLTRQIVQTLEPIYIDSPPADDAEHPTALIREYGAQVLVGLPLMARGRAIGAVFLMRLTYSTPFDPQKIQPALASLDQLALLVDNQLLFDSTNSRLAETNALVEMAALAAAASDLDDLLARALAFSCRLLNIHDVAVWLYDATVDLLHYHSGAGRLKLAGALSEHSIPPDDSPPMILETVQADQAFIMNNMAHNLNAAEQEVVLGLRLLLKTEALDSIMITPLGSAQDQLGVFIVANKAGGFSRGDAGLLMALSSHIGAALRNAQLLQQARNRLGETEILQRIAAITAAPLEQDEMLFIALLEIAQRFEADGAELLMLDRVQEKLIPHQSSVYGVVKNWAGSALALDAEDRRVAVFQSGMPYLANTPPAGEAVPWHNCLILPLQTRQGIIGVIGLYDRRVGDFTGSHGDLGLTLCSQVAVAIQSVRLLDAEHQRADLMLLINRIGQELSATLDLRGVMRKVVENLHERLGYDTVAIFLLDNETNSLVCQASAANDARHVLEVGFSLPLEHGLVGRVMQDKRSALVWDVHQIENFGDIADFEDLRSALVVPLRHGEHVFGVIELLRGEEGGFNETDLIAMESLASQISVAIDNAQLYNQAQRRLLEQGIVHQIGQDLSAILDYNELVQAVARHMSRALDTSTCGVAIYDGRRERIRIEAIYRLPGSEEHIGASVQVGKVYPLEQFPIAYEALKQRRSIVTYVDDPNAIPSHIEQLRQNEAYSQLIVPMVIGQRAIGFVRWAEHRRKRRFTRDDERLAQTLISQAAIALENARLFREVERRASEQALLNQLSVALTAANQIDDLVLRFTQQVHEAIKAQDTLVCLFDNDGRLTIAGQQLALTSAPEELVLPRLRQDPNSGRRILNALARGESIYTGFDTSTQTGGQIELALLSPEPLAIALIPMLYRDTLIGVIELRLDNPGGFDRYTIQLLEALANQAGIALDNMRLSQREQRRLRQMERIQASGRLIASELVLQNLLELVVQEAAAIFDVPAIALVRPDEFGTGEVIKAAYGLSENFVQKRRMPINPTHERTTLTNEQREPSYYPDLNQIARSEEQKALTLQEGLHSAVFIPIIKGNRKYGSLILYSDQMAYHFDEEDIEIAQLLASQVAVAIDNADLFLKLEERAFELAEANRLKSHFLANISHELRTPMNSILGFSETLMTGLYGELNEKQGSRIERIWHNGKNLLALIDDLLDLSKIDAGQMQISLQSVDLGEEIHTTLSAFEALAEEKGIYIRASLPPNLPLVRADSLRLRQIITNLLGNAIKFTHQGGVDVLVEAKREIKLAPMENEELYQDVVWVGVRDTGIGISLEDQLIIFDEFRQVDGSTTREYGGTGLGLAICKRLIELMGGRIWVDSEIGSGSIFTFVLPVASQ